MKMSLSFVPFLILILCNLDGIPTVNSLNDEGSALLTFKLSIKQDPSASLNNWVDSGDTPSPCSWNGVACEQQKVVSLILPNNQLSGSLSSSLGSLSDLRILNLSTNSFYGVLPPELFKAQDLQSLVLDGNFLSGLLPFEVGNLQHLQTLDLSRNLLSGSIPVSLIQCTSLRALDLSRNNFTGTLPDEIGGSLVLLERLNLSYNEFGGSIPGGLGRLSNLQGTLDLSHNMFTGSIPSDLGSLPEELYVDLAYNNLSGPIPRNVNRGPAAFIGNVGLCGPPLDKPCSFNGGSSPPSSFQIEGGRGLSKASVAAIVVCGLVGICVIGLLSLRFCCGDKKGKIELGGECKNRIECLCFRKDESETLSEEAEQYDLVALDGQVGFNLDQLLKASAFMLGKSGIGILYKVVLEDGQCLAVRRLGEEGSNKCKEFQMEVESLGKLRHRNIVNLRAYYWSVDEKLLVYDFLPNGNLANAIHGKPGLDPLPWATRLEIMKGVARGLVYLHEYSPKKYVHGNLTPTKILLGHDVGPKISDLGLARLATLTDGLSPSVGSNQTSVFEKQSSESASISSSYYQAPESLKAKKPSKKWDVYSYGVILLEMITGRGSVMELVQVCVEEMVDPHLNRVEEEEINVVLKIVMGCLQSTPERRPSMGRVLERMERVGAVV